MLQHSTENPMPKCAVGTSWRSQFRYPRGLLGWFVGQLMAVKNEPRSLWVLSQLKLRPSDHLGLDDEFAGKLRDILIRRIGMAEAKPSCCPAAPSVFRTNERISSPSTAKRRNRFRRIFPTP